MLGCVALAFRCADVPHRHMISNPDHAVAPTFLTLPGSSFVVNGAAQARDAALTAASAEVKWRNGVAIGATFEGEFSNVTRSHAGKGIVRYVW